MSVPASARPSRGFRHEAMLYTGEADFVRGAADFLRTGLEAGEPALVLVSPRKIELLRGALGPQADRVRFADMAEVGPNPARIIPVWQAFVDGDGLGGRRVRGIGEPVTAERGPAELAECQRHEALLNLAFDEHPAFTLLCPYDTTALSTAVLDDARRTHPHLTCDGISTPSPDFSGVPDPLVDDESLPEPAVPTAEFMLGPGRLSVLRDFLWKHAATVGLSRDRAEDLVVAANEVATNSLLYGGGYGTVRLWRQSRTVVCEIADSGHIDEPLVGRQPPDPEDDGGRGLWMVNQLCDLTQLRSSESGTVFRLHLDCS